MQVRMMSESQGGMSGFTISGGTGGRFTCMYMILRGSPESNGSMPVDILYSITPSE